MNNNTELHHSDQAMDERLRANDLFDVYGSLLTKRQQEILTLYVLDDLSLSEIQEMLSISRSAISDAVRKGIHAMEEMEKSVGYLEKRRQVLDEVKGNKELEDRIRSIYFAEK